MEQKKSGVPAGMREIRRSSAKPLYLAAAVWLLAAFIAPMYRLTAILITAAVSVLAFFLGKKLFPDTVSYEEAPPDPQDEAALAVYNGRDAIRRIGELNRKIADEELSRQMDRIEKAGFAIFDHLEEHPEKLSKVRRFMNYYLPTTIKLLTVYEKMGSRDIAGDNIDSAMKNIREIMGTVAGAFEQQYDNLFSGEALDISTDIAVFEQMLKGEGLAQQMDGEDPSEDQRGKVTLTL